MGLIVSLFIVGAAFAGGFFIYNKNKVRLGIETVPSTNLIGSGSIAGLQINSIVKLMNYGNPAEDFDTQVTRKDTFSESGKVWYQYELDAGNKKFCLFTQSQTNWQAYLQIATKRMEEIGITEADLRNYRAAVNGTFVYNNITFKYQRAGTAFLKINDNAANGMDYWYFNSIDTNYILKVERLDAREPLAVTIFELLPSHKYEIL